MRAVLDENVPRKLIVALRERACDVAPFPNAWKGLRNGKLLERLEQSGFDCLITCDKNMEWQQPLQKREVAVLVLPLQDLSVLMSRALEIAAAVASARRGEAVHLSSRSSGLG